MIIAALLMFLVFSCILGLILGCCFYLVGSLSQAEDERNQLETDLLRSTLTDK